MAYSDTGTVKPPHDLDAEVFVLGGLLHVGAKRGNNAFFDELSEMLTSDDFFAEECRTVWNAMSNVANKGIIVTRQTVTENIASTGVWTHQKTLAEIINILVDDASHVSFEIKDYAGLVARLGARRRLVFVGQEIESMALQPGHDAAASKIYSDARAMLDEAEAVKRTVGEWESAGDAVAAEIDALERRMIEGVTPGISTGIEKVDSMLGGLHRGDLLVLAGASSMGKTATAMSLCTGAARTDSARVAVFSQEMTREQLAWRLAASEADRHGYGAIEYQSLRNATVTASQIDILRRGQKHVPHTLNWNCARGMSFADVRAALRRAKRAMGGVDVVCIDYLQIMAIEQARGDTRAKAIGDLTMSLKNLAGDENCAVVLISQLKRGIEERDNKRPRLSDLRESGSIEQDADTVLFAYREEYYLERQEPDITDTDAHTQWMVDLSPHRNKLDIIIGKQRMGPIGSVPLYFKKETDLILDNAPADPQGGFNYE